MLDCGRPDGRAAALVGVRLRLRQVFCHERHIPRHRIGHIPLCAVLRPIAEFHITLGDLGGIRHIRKRLVQLRLHRRGRVAVVRILLVVQLLVLHRKPCRRVHKAFVVSYLDVPGAVPASVPETSVNAVER